MTVSLQARTPAQPATVDAAASILRGAKRSLQLAAPAVTPTSGDAARHVATQLLDHARVGIASVVRSGVVDVHDPRSTLLYAQMGAGQAANNAHPIIGARDADGMHDAQRWIGQAQAQVDGALAALHGIHG